MSAPVPGTILGWLAAALVAGAGVLWFRRIAAVRVPERRTGFHLAFGGGALLGVAAFVVGTTWAGGLAAVFAIVGGLMMIGLRLQSAQRRSTPAVSVGGPILEFAAPDAEGSTFELASLRGRPFLLKFFRGHW